MKICGTPPKLSLADAVLMRSLFKAGHNKTQLATRFGIAVKTVTNYLSATHKSPDLRWLDPVPQSGMATGASNGNVKLTERAVSEIKQSLRTTGGRGVFAALGRRYGVHPATISRIGSGRLWANVE